MEPLARHGALPAAPRRICSPATSTGPAPCSRSRPRWQPRRCQRRLARPQRVRARVAGDGSRAMGGGGRARGTGARRHRRASDARLRHERARLRRRGPARRAPRRPGRRRTGSSPGRCEPVRRARSCCRSSPCGYRLQLAKVHWAMGDHPTARHLLREIDDILLHRPALGALVDEVSEFRRVLTSSTQAGAAGGTPLTPAELRLLPYLQTHLTIREIGERLFVSRNTVSTEVGSIYRKLGVSSRSDAVRPGDDDRAARRVADITRRAGVPGRRRGRSRAPAPASAPPRRRTGARRRE